MTRIVVAISTVLGVLATLATIVMMVAIAADVVYRTGWHKSVPGLLELSETALVAAVFLGMAYTGATNGHIAVDLVTERVPAAVSRWMIATGWIASCIILGWMLYATFVRAVSATVENEVRMGIVHWPLWPGRWLVVIGLAAMLLVAITNVVRVIGGKEVLGFKEFDTVATDTTTFNIASEEREALSSLGAANEPVVQVHDGSTGENK